MRHRSIGGWLNYRALADLHRPRTREGMALAVRELIRQGLRVRDVADALNISLTDVLDAIRERR
jgi:hypothetical protein